MEDNIEAWVNLQDDPDVGKIQETICSQSRNQDATTYAEDG